MLLCMCVGKHTYMYDVEGRREPRVLFLELLSTSFETDAFIGPEVIN